VSQTERVLRDVQLGHFVQVESLRMGYPRSGEVFCQCGSWASGHMPRDVQRQGRGLESVRIVSSDSCFGQLRVYLWELLELRWTEQERNPAWSRGSIQLPSQEASWVEPRLSHRGRSCTAVQAGNMSLDGI
jgi:hypothetical protein